MICKRMFSGQPEEEEDDLHPADDGEASEEPHGPPHSPHHVAQLHLAVFGDSVKGWSVEVNPHKV